MATQCTPAQLSFHGLGRRQFKGRFDGVVGLLVARPDDVALPWPDGRYDRRACCIRPTCRARARADRPLKWNAECTWSA